MGHPRSIGGFDHIVANGVELVKEKGMHVFLS